MKIMPRLAILGTIATVFVAGCTFPSSRTTVPRSHVGVMQRLDLGQVVAVREVVIDGEKTYLGIASGGSIGAAAGYPGGRANTGDYVVQAISATAGAIVGAAVEELATRKLGQEITVQLDTGDTVVIIQEADDGYFQEGDRVQVHSAQGVASVRIAMN